MIVVDIKPELGIDTVNETEPEPEPGADAGTRVEVDVEGRAGGSLDARLEWVVDRRRV